MNTCLREKRTSRLAVSLNSLELLRRWPNLHSHCSVGTAESQVYFDGLTGQAPRSRFTGTLSIEMSKSKISIGIPSVVHAFGISTIPAIDPRTGALDSRRYTCSPEYPIMVSLPSCMCRPLTSLLTKLLEVLDCTEAGLSICHGGVHKVLLSCLIDRKALKGEITRGAKGGTHVPWSKHGTLEAP